MDDILTTDFTPTIHKASYPAIDPRRPELSQAGRSVLITGGGTNIGKSIAEHFILANAANVVITGRRLDVLEAAAAELTEQAREGKSPSKVFAFKTDVTDTTATAKLFQSIVKEKILLDVLVLNAAKFHDPALPLLETGMDEVWSSMEANVKGPMYLTEQFMKQNEDKPKFLVNLTSAVIHAHQHPMVIERAAYGLSKSAGTLFVQLLANQIPVEKLQVVTFHPGAVWNPSWPLPKDAMEWDEMSLPGAFAVWAASREAAFLNGRTVWAAWDVEEMTSGDVGKLIKEDGDYLRISVVGYKNSKRAPRYR